MKTKEVIRRLQEVDPSGETECCIGNEDILTIYKSPAYWDGPLQVLQRDETNPYYNVIGAKITQEGNKIVIQPHSITDALLDNENLPVDLTELGEHKRAEYEQSIEKTRQEYRKLNTEIELDFFKNWAKTKALELFNEVDRVPYLAETTYRENNLSYNDPLPEELKKRSDISWHNRRQMQWDSMFTISWDGYDFKITRKG